MKPLLKAASECKRACVKSLGKDHKPFWLLGQAFVLHTRPCVHGTGKSPSPHINLALMMQLSCHWSVATIERGPPWHTPHIVWYTTSGQRINN